MAIALAVFSIVIVAMSLYGAAQPERLTALVRRFMTDIGINIGLWIAVIVRLVLAVLLWFVAPVSHTPMTFQVLALLVLAAAVFLPLIGAKRLIKLIDHVASWPPLAIRFWCVLGVAFGLFLLWSVSPGLTAT